ncbi:sequence-specific DNA binding, partial [Halocaridina rubra]
ISRANISQPFPYLKLKEEAALLLPQSLQHLQPPPPPLPPTESPSSSSSENLGNDEKPKIIPSTVITASLAASSSPTSLSSPSVSSQNFNAANTSFRRMVEMPPLSPLISEPPSPECKQESGPGTSSSVLSNTVLSVPSIKTSMGLIRPSAVVVTQRTGVGVSHSPTSRLGLSSLTLRLPSTSASSSNSSGSSTSSSDGGYCMPPTPPSCSSSDSECGGHSPTRTPPLYETLKPQFCNPRKGTARILVSSRNPINTPLISTQPKGATGAINLTEEEKRTLISEGYSIPSRLPLTKTEEKSLKKIRRKIKNKISAQESRRKKKEYMDALERKVEKLSSENSDCKRRIDILQSTNKQLMLELQTLQNFVEREEKNRIRSTPMATLLA